MTLRNIVFWPIAVLLAAISSASPGAEKSPHAPLETVSLQLKWFHQFQFAGYYAAKEKGYYASEGLDVEIRELFPGKTVVTQVVSHEADFGIGDSGIIVNYANGDPIAALAAIFQHDPLIFISKQSSGIVSPYEMAGKRIMFNAEGADEAPLRAMLVNAGLSEDKFIYVKHSFDNDDLIRDKVDVMSAYITDEPFYFLQKGISLNLVNPQNYGFDFYGDILFTSRHELTEHPGRAERFLRATIKGWQYALDHPEELVQLIHSRYGKRLSIEHLRHEAQEIRKLILPDAIPLGRIEAGRLRRVAEIYNRLNMAKPLGDGQLEKFIYGSQPKLKLSAEELARLNRRPVIRVGIDRDFAPYEWVDAKGNYIGMTADFMRLIEQRLGVRFEIVKNKPWPEILQMAQRGELELLTDAVKTPDRERYLSFTEPYFHHPIVIITSNAQGYIGSLDNLKGKRVAVEKGYFMQELLTREHPEIRVIAFDGVREALQQTAEGKVDAYIGHAASASYIIKQQGLMQLSFSGETGYYGDHSIAVAKADPLLQGILEKALASISEEERNKIQNHWMSLKIEHGVKPAILLKYAAAALVLLLLFAYWIYRLRKEAAKRRLVETALRQSEAKLLAILETEPQCVKITDAEGRLAYMNRAGLVMIEAEDCPAQVMGEAVDSLVVAQDRQAFNEMNRRVLEEGQEGKLEFEIEGLRGTRRHMETHATPFRDAATGAVSVLAVTRDVTQRKEAEAQLRESEAKFRAIIDVSPVPYALNDDAQNITFLNRAFLQTYGYTPEDIPTLADWWPKAFPDPGYRHRVAETWHANLDKAAREKTAFEPLELTIRCKNGEVKTAMASAAALGEGLEKTHLVILYDISERKKNEEKLILAARVFSEAHEAIVITDAVGTIVDVNPTYCEITGYSRAEVIGKNPNILKSGKQSPEFYAAMWKTLSEEGHWQGEVWNRKKTGEIYPELLTISALRDHAGKIINYLGLFSDITQLKHQQQTLEMMAHYDPLTRLPNRILFADRFAQSVARCKREKTLLGICYLDLDGFKPVNDTYGHETGDQLLIQVAERIKSILREEDTVSRLGGDEFALLLVDLETIEQFENALARIHHAVAQPISIDGQQIKVSASSGLTIYPVDDNDSDTLLRHADQAMYKAKLAGRNCYRLFDPEHNKHMHSRREAMNVIEQAFYDAQFCLYYQPKVDMKSAEVVGAEALIRWNHPARGVLPPMEFLPVIEGTSLEIALGNWVIEEVFKQLEDRKKAGLEIQISLNISPRHLQWKGFVAELEAALNRHPGIDSRLLELEVLETTVLVDLISAGNTLRECYQRLGVPFALDDFGTGYSSLTHLRHLPVSTVKIDQSFVRDMLDDSDDLAIVQSVVGLAQAFKREVIAEGVESVEHGLVLLNIGCHTAQGYAIAPAMPASVFIEWERNYRSCEEWLSYARNPPSVWQAQMLTIDIELDTFVKRIEAHLLHPDGSSQRWPILNAKKSHLGNWIIQAGKDQSVDQDLLNSLQSAHEKLLHSGNILKQHHQEGKIEAALAGLETLNEMRRNITDILARL